jgi:hypothetical protein
VSSKPAKKKSTGKMPVAHSRLYQRAQQTRFAASISLYAKKFAGASCFRRTAAKNEIV